MYPAQLLQPSTPPNHPRCRRLGGTLALVAAVVFLAACNSPAGGPEETRSGQAEAPPKDALKLVFTYGSEKARWIEEVTTDFNHQRRTLADGRPIFVEAHAMGSGESIAELVEGRRQAHLTSPASEAFIKLGNAESRLHTGQDLIGPTRNLVLSPVVIAMWKPMAEAIGWGQRPLGWSDVLEMSRKREGWAAYGRPQWGSFKFGHTHPEYSNSGLISLFAEVYAATGKTAGLSAEDLEKPATAEFLAAIERSVVHYGSSTGFFGRKMFSNGPEYLSAAVLYENMVIESYGPEHSLPFPVVAIYPKEGTFWSDHPAGIVQREWVTAAHREAAEVYLDFLLAPEQQRQALLFGFRPAEVEIPLAAPVDTAHGVDPQQPQTILEVPSPEVIHGVIRLWSQHKKHADVTLVLDVSGSMKDDDKLASAKQGARQLLSMLRDEDRFSLLTFNNDTAWALTDLSLAQERGTAEGQVESLFAAGGTALYDAVDTAYQRMQEQRDSARIAAIVVLSDGADTRSKLDLNGLLKRIRFDAEGSNIRVFTISYGQDADREVLTSIADATEAESFTGTPDNIREVFKNISTFF